MVEALMRVAPPRETQPAKGVASPIREARFCYDHLAGVTASGAAKFKALGMRLR